MLLVIVAVVSAIVAAAIYHLFYFKSQLKKAEEAFRKKFEHYKKDELERMAQQIVRKRFHDAELEARELRESAKKFYKKVKAQYEAQLKDLNERQKILDERARQLDSKEKELYRSLEDIDKQRKNLVTQLEKVSSMTHAEARKEILRQAEEEIKHYKARKLRSLKSEISEKANEYAHELILDTLQSIATDHIDEATVARVEIENEDIKGKIIGKDGRNIRAFEKATGVDVIIDEAPTYIGLSSFDPIRREVARIALANLIKDGRIHPGTIEEQVNKAKKLVANELEKAGKEIAEKAEWYDVPKDLLPILGRMKYRRSVGQNLYKHTLEVVEIAEYIAKELQLSPREIKDLKIAAVMHDVGKVFTSKVKKPHHFISADLAKKHGLNNTIINAIKAHHGDVEPESAAAEILKIADAISGARPGARKENLENYVERVENLEKKALEVAGDKAEDIYALKAGRELRVVVKPSAVSDDEAALLAHDIAKAIEASGVFPGEVNVVVIKEVRAHAKAAKS